MSIAKVSGGPSGYAGTVFASGPGGSSAYTVTGSPPDMEVRYDVATRAGVTRVTLAGSEVVVPRDQAVSSGHRQAIVRFDLGGITIGYDTGLVTLPFEVTYPAAVRVSAAKRATGMAVIEPDGRIRFTGAVERGGRHANDPVGGQLMGDARVDAMGRIAGLTLRAWLNDFFQRAGTSGVPL